MPRYIDADLLIKNLNLLVNRSFLGEIRCTSEISIGEIASLIVDQPIAEVQPVIHGKWIDDCCNICGAYIPTDNKHDYISENDCKYCLECGAKMDDGNNG